MRLARSPPLQYSMTIARCRGVTNTSCSKKHGSPQRSTHQSAGSATPHEARRQTAMIPQLPGVKDKAG